MHLSPFTRFAILLPTVMLLGVTLFATVSYDETRKVMISEFHAALREEITALETIYQIQGYKALTAVVAARARANRNFMNDEAIAVYLLTDATGNKLAGNLDSWPAGVEAQDESSVQFIEPRSGDTVVAVLFLLYQDQRLLVGRRAVFEHVGQHLWRNYALLVGLVVLVSLVGGWWFTRGLRHRLGQISATAERIRHGHMHERIPQTRNKNEIERLIRQLNAMLEQLEILVNHARNTSSAIAHDLRHPINRLRHALESLAEDTQDPATIVRIEEILTDIDSLQRTFQAILRLGRLEAGAYQLNLEAGDVAEIVADAIALYEPMAEAQHRRIQLSAESMPMEADRPLLFQALANLLENALRYGTGDIDVKCGQQMISIRDHGPGIPDSDLQDVLKPFVRVDESRNRPGSGLGLSLVKAIVEAHNGQIELKNAGPGLQATLRFSQQG